MCSCARGALLAPDLTTGVVLAARLAGSQPGLRWQVFTDPAQAVMELCSGRYDVGVVGADGLQLDIEMLLRPVRRCAPTTRLLTHASDLSAPSLRHLLTRRWLTCVRTDALAQALA